MAAGLPEPLPCLVVVFVPPAANCGLGYEKFFVGPLLQVLHRTKQ
jgi:hypothetical protein